MKVKLTMKQREEIFFKLDIVSCEDDLLRDYEVTHAEVMELKNKFNDNKKGIRAVEFDSEYADMIIGELENCEEIAEANIEHGDTGYIGYLRMIRNAMKKINKERAV